MAPSTRTASRPSSTPANNSPVELLDGVADTIDALAADYRLLIVTKGDPSDQHRKVSACGIDDRFWAVEVVPEKDPATYRAVLGRHDVAPEAFTMVGNSVPSDVLPVLAVGGRAVHIPHHSTWLHEVVDPATITHDFPVLDSFGQLPGFLPGFLAGDR